MLKRIIETSSQSGDLVLDCFAGSGTTLLAAEELGRNWIGVDIGDEAISTIVNRLRFGSKPMGDYVMKKKKNVDTMPLFDENSFSTSSERNETAMNNIAYDLFEEI